MKIRLPFILTSVLTMNLNLHAADQSGDCAKKQEIIEQLQDRWKAANGTLAKWQVPSSSTANIHGTFCHACIFRPAAPATRS